MASGSTRPRGPLASILLGAAVAGSALAEPGDNQPFAAQDSSQPIEQAAPPIAPPAGAPSGAPLFAPPPRSVADITDLLRSARGLDPQTVRELQVAIAREPPADLRADARWEFYRERAWKASDLGRVDRFIADLRTAA